MGKTNIIGNAAALHANKRIIDNMKRVAAEIMKEIIEQETRTTNEQHV